MLKRNKKLPLRALGLFPAVQKVNGVEVRYRGTLSLADGIEKFADRIVAEYIAKVMWIHYEPSLVHKFNFGGIERLEIIVR